MSESPEAGLKELQERCGSLSMATIAADGSPHSSYTPFYLDDGSYLIFISLLSLHTQNILGNPKVGVMLIEDEADARQLFVRHRLLLNCIATQILPDDASYNELLNKYQDRHGKTVELLRQLSDFCLIRLKPVSGRYVVGFGQAFELKGEKLDQLEHIGPA